jgi:membrane-bound serine protease (ClpP class)
MNPVPVWNRTRFTRPRSANTAVGVALSILLCTTAIGLGHPIACYGRVQAINDNGNESRGGADQVDRDSKGDSQTFVIPLEGPIDPAMHSFLRRKFDEAIAGGAETIVLDIDSGGGRIDSTFEIVELIGESDVKTMAYIRHAALSGAAIVALACDRIEMHPEAQMGDVGVIVGGAFSPFQYVEEKERSPVVSMVRTLAVASGRPAALAQAMVEMDLVVFSATNQDDGRIGYFTASEWDSIEQPNRWTKGPPVFETREKNFLTVSGQRAVELGLAEGTSRSLDDALDAVSARRPVTVLARTWVDGTVETLNSFWLTGLLVVVGLAALLFELSAPGLGVGGLTSLLCFALFFWSRFLGGTAGWLEVTLFITSLAFIAAEFFVIPGFGFAGITGIGLMVFSLVMASRRVLIPTDGADWTDLGLNFFTILAALAGVLCIAFFAADYFQSVPLFKRLVLEPPSVGQVSDNRPGEGTKEAENVSPWSRISVGDFGRSLSPLRPSGKAQFAEDIVDVATEGEFIASDSPIRVHRKTGMRIIVRQA